MPSSTPPPPPPSNGVETPSSSASSGPSSKPQSAATTTASTLFSPRRTRVLKRMAAGAVISAVPVFLWWKWSLDQRQKRLEDVRTRVRVPNVQTVDDLMIERCRPGDVLLFDRRWELCCAGPFSALLCMVARKFICGDDPNKSNTEGVFDHIGIIVPGYANNKAQENDPSNLLVLEVTAGEGIVARPLLQRLEVSQSRSVILLPLAYPAERRNDELYDETESDKSVEKIVKKTLQDFRDRWVTLSKEKRYERAHASLGLLGAFMYAVGYHDRNPGPTSPSAWLVTMALQDAKVAQSMSERHSKEAKPEDFLRDYRFQDQNVIRLRPGWRFLAPVPFRET